MVSRLKINILKDDRIGMNLVQNNNKKLSVRRVLYIGKSILAFLLVCAVFKTAGSLWNISGILAPVEAKAKVRSDIKLPRTESKTTPKLSIEDFARIIKKDPFGASNNTAGPGQSLTLSNPPRFDSSFARQSGLTLMGTISGSSSVARAIIKNSQTNTP